MSTLQNEELLSLPAVAKVLPSPPHVTTLHRWVQKGIKGVRLESVRVGGRRYCSREAMQRFIDRLSGQDSSLTSTAQAATPTARKKELVESQLDALGIK